MRPPAANFSHVCLSRQQQMVHGSDLEYALQRYFYPTVAIFGIFGNMLNLTVLLNRSMRNRANTFLSVLAFADIIFLFLLFPNILANYSIFTFNYSFRWLYFHSKVHLLSLANWCSAVAIWCVILVCADRLVGIRNPLYVRGSWGRGRMPALLSAVFILTGAMTAYQHVEYFCLVRSYCNDTQLYSRCMPINNDGSWWGNQTNPFSSAFRQFLATSAMLYIFAMILFPIVLLTALNALLLGALRHRQRALSFGGTASVDCSHRRRAAEPTAFQKTEHRVTLTVTCIVTMFTVTNVPSALLYFLRTAYQLNAARLYNVTMICSTLVICGKASNFILFCLGSRHFRLRLIKMAQLKVHRQLGVHSRHFDKCRSARSVGGGGPPSEYEREARESLRSSSAGRGSRSLSVTDAGSLPAAGKQRSNGYTSVRNGQPHPQRL